jgi:hypothetical protein
MRSWILIGDHVRDSALSVPFQRATYDVVMRRKWIRVLSYYSLKSYPNRSTCWSHEHSMRLTTAPRPTVIFLRAFVSRIIIPKKYTHFDKGLRWFE